MVDSDFDFSEMRAGDFVTERTLAGVFREEPGSDRYRLKLLALWERARRARPELYFKTSQNGLRALTANEALEANLRDTQQALRRVQRLGSDAQSRIASGELAETSRKTLSALQGFHSGLSLTAIGERSKLRALQATMPRPLKRG